MPPEIANTTAAATHRRKYILWLAMAAATISVVLYSEVPLLRKPEEHAHLHDLRWILIPHALCGILAFLLGPTQFSTRLRLYSVRLHRTLGRTYVACVAIAAPLAIWSTAYADYPHPHYFQAATAVQGTAWFTTTAVAFIAAICRRIPTHRRWMIRSYAVTFTFVSTRVLRPIPAWNHMGRGRIAVAIICVTLASIFAPEIGSQLASLFKRLSTSSPSAP